MSTPGTLYIVATPIGNLKDISQRAIETLQSVDLIAAEDTRHSAKLLQHFAINTRTISLHEHNEREKALTLISHLKQGHNIALITDAGTPLLSDPGYHLVYLARTQQITVSPIPGPCAAIAALCASGLPSDSFVFEGFLSPKSSSRIQQLSLLKQETRTIVFYEAPHRIVSLFGDLIKSFGGDRQAVIARELTKTFETFLMGTLSEIEQQLNEDTQQQLGEFVVLVHGAEKVTESDESALKSREILNILLNELSVKQAVSLAIKITGENKNRLYQWALDEKKLTN